MKELSLNILDIAENSVKAGASLTEIRLDQTEEMLTITIRDDGCGMDAQTVSRVTDPFYTTRTTRPVGLGLPLLKLEAEMTGGTVTVESKDQVQYPQDHGTTVKAVFYHTHIDCPPLGDVIGTMVTLVQGHPDTDFLFRHECAGREAVELDTRMLREVLGEIPLNSFEVLQWIQGSLLEAYESWGTT